MIKRIFTRTALISFAVLTGCNQITGSVQTPASFQQDNFYQSQKKNADWFTNLRPDLKIYYADARGKTGEALFNALHTIISRNNNISDYNSAKAFMYSDADNIELNKTRGIMTAYSQVFIAGKSNNGSNYRESGDENQDTYQGDFITCEHTWPQSYFNKSMPMAADIHHLLPTFSIPNNKRGYYSFGEVTGTVVYSTGSGSKLYATAETSEKMSPADLKKLMNLDFKNREFILRKLNLNFEFEPADKQKGNTARAMMYFFLRYHKDNIRSGSFDEKEFWDSKVAMLRKWSEQVDSVDTHEARRNEIVHQRQGNRNPFIDIPGLASLITDDVMIRK